MDIGFRRPPPCSWLLLAAAHGCCTSLLWCRVFEPALYRSPWSWVLGSIGTVSSQAIGSLRRSSSCETMPHSNPALTTRSASSIVAMAEHCCLMAISCFRHSDMTSTRRRRVSLSISLSARSSLSSSLFSRKMAYFLYASGSIFNVYSSFFPLISLFDCSTCPLIWSMSSAQS